MSATDFQGWLIKFPKTNQLFPHELIDKDNYKSTPLQRTELKSYRDNNILLHRVTSPNYKSKIEFQTLKINLAQLAQIRTVLDAAFDNRKERKLRVTYWDDELLAYRTMTAYMTDTTYTVSTISDSSIKYNTIRFSFIEY